MLPLLAMALVAQPAAPTDQSLIYYNARMALREGRAKEAVKLWLLRNAVESETGVVSAHDEDLRSVTWAALGDLGLCQDGFSADHAPGGAGLWPLALHNSVVRNMRRQTPLPGPSPFQSFALGRQQRHVSVHDVLDATELRSVELRRSFCLWHIRVLLEAGEAWNARLADRQVAARVLRHLLRQGGETLAAERVVGRAVIESRLFDLNLQLAGLAARAKRREQRETRREGRYKGLSRAELADQQATDTRPVVPPDSEAGRILRGSLAWPAEEWLTLSSDRRLFLFAQAARTAPDPASLRPLELQLVDRQIEARQGAEVRSWIAWLTADGDEASRRLVWHGRRGRRLLSLDADSGFRERSVIALHRGVDLLQTGRLPEALRSLAYAVSWAETSRAADEVRNLGRRWLSFVASQFRLTDELFAVLRSVVPRGDYGAVLEDQLWHAALSADRASFELCLRHRAGRGALNRRAEVLRPLAMGDAAAFESHIAASLLEAPHAATRFLRMLVERLQAEDGEVRVAHLPTLRRLKEHLEAAVVRAADEGRQHKHAEALIVELRAIIEGATGVAEVGAEDQAHALSPEREVFGGSLRVAPSDPLPWPFVVAEVEAPSVFRPIELRPEEWRDASGALVFGWRIED